LLVFSQEEAGMGKREEEDEDVKVKQLGEWPKVGRPQALRKHKTGNSKLKVCGCSLAVVCAPVLLLLLLFMPLALLLLLHVPAHLKLPCQLLLNPT
jgi:hypothetical protein